MLDTVEFFQDAWEPFRVHARKLIHDRPRGLVIVGGVLLWTLETLASLDGKLEAAMGRGSWWENRRSASCRLSLTTAEMGFHMASWDTFGGWSVPS